MNIQDLSVKLGVSVSATVLQPAANDLLVLKVDAFLSAKQRELLENNLLPTLKGLGCKVMVLEGGMDLMLVKQVANDVDSSADDQVKA
jgi:hypothetical protein